MKKLVSSIVAMLTVTVLFAQVKEYVGIVREQYYPELVTFLEEYKTELKNEGYSTYAKSIDAYLEGGFGSGFVYVAPDGKNYIITNRHVVSQASSASIEFDDENNTKYENLKVLATSDDIDIAILAFENDERPFKQGLTFSSKQIKDGDDVWSAGFPGLGSEPLWQFGKGTVTNSTAKIKELLDPSISSLIQHSAQIDSGNSGGPLLIASNNKVGYEVIGINTWKATYRQNTNYSIPAKVVQDFINNYTSDDYAERAEKFASAFTDKDADFTSIAKYISYETAAQKGKESLESVLRFAPSAVRSVVVDAFDSSPIEGLRYAYAYQLWKKFAPSTSDEITEFKILDSQQDGENWIINIQGTKEIKSVWMKEHGLWRLQSAAYTDDKEETEEEKSKQKEKKSTYQAAYLTEPPSVIDFFGGVAACEDLGNKKNLTLGLDAWVLDGQYLGVGFDFKNLPALNSTDTIKWFDGNLIGRIPLNLGPICISPTAGVGYILCFRSSKFSFGFDYKVGVDFYYTGSYSWVPAIGVSYSKQFLDFSSVLEENKNNNKLDSVCIYVKIGF